MISFVTVEKILGPTAKDLICDSWEESGRFRVIDGYYNHCPVHRGVLQTSAQQLASSTMIKFHNNQIFWMILRRISNITSLAGCSAAAHWAIPYLCWGSSAQTVSYLIHPNKSQLNYVETDQGLLGKNKTNVYYTRRQQSIQTWPRCLESTHCWVQGQV